MTNSSYTLSEKLGKIATQFPDEIAVQIRTETSHKKLTYQEFYQTSKTIAQGLIGLGIEKQDKIAIILENCPEWGMIFFGIMLCAATAVPLDPQSSTEEILHALNQSHTKIIFTSKKTFSALEKIIPDLRYLTQIIIIPLDSRVRGNDDNKIATYSKFLAHNKPCPLPTASPNDIASILYTSGTTGNPKGVMLSHKNFYSNFCSINKLKLTKANDNMLSILPLHHSFPFMVTLLIPLFTKTRITYIDNIKIETITKTLNEENITIFAVVPQLLNIIAKQIRNKIKSLSPFIRWPLQGTLELLWILRKYLGINLNKVLIKPLHAHFGKKLRLFACGGAKLDNKTSLFLSKLGFTILQGYGLTETAPIVTFNSSGIKKLNSVGQPIPNEQIKIINPDKNGIGEVAIKGPNVMLGYYNNDSETAKTIINGWFHSGDLGHIDRQKYLFLTGRKKEVIVLSSGKNIIPEEVEAHYLKSPYIKELCVMLSDKNREDKLLAVIAPDLEYFRKQKLVNLHGMLKWDLENLSKNYPNYKRIMGFVIAKNELPKTRLGKLKRYEIKEHFLPEFAGNRQKKESSAPSNKADLHLYSSQTIKQLLSIIAREMSLKTAPNLTDHLELDLGIDSLQRIELMGALEKELNINIPPTIMAKTFTVRELAIEIESLTTNKGTQPTKSQRQSWHDILYTDPSPSLLKEINLSPSLPNKITSHFIAGLMTFLAKIIWRLKVVGIENLPKKEPFILCPNHASYLDGGLIAAALPKWLVNRFFILSYSAIFQRTGVRHLIKLLKIIPIDQVIQLIDAMQVSAYILRNNNVLALFPAGARSIDGKVQEFKKGVGILAKELDLRLVPVYIKGSFEAWPRGKQFPKPHEITVIYGKALTVEELQKNGRKLGATTDYQAITLAIRNAVIQLTETDFSK